MNRSYLKQYIYLAVLALMFGCINWFHQSTMFENDRHFSHLSTLEREMTFRTEMGLYYHYFKVIIEAPTLWSGIKKIMNDKHTEYPSVINTLERFNLYPEVLLSLGYRSYMKIANFFQIKTTNCWQVLRGEGLSPVESCEGLGEPSYFYVTSVFVFNGLISASLFLYGTHLSGSKVCGIVSVILYFFNHGESTRVQWTPPLRESFGYPIFLLQMLIVSITLRTQKNEWIHAVMIGTLTAIFILFWQFAQFALLTQVMAVFFTYTVGLIPSSKFQLFLKGHIFGLLIALIFLFWNKMLLISLYSSSLIIAYIISREKRLDYFNMKLLNMLIKGMLFFIGLFQIKSLLSTVLNVKDDVHIWNILRSKMSSYKDFHTMLYTCAIEFDFLEFKTLVNLTKTVLLPIFIIAVFAIPIKLLLQRKSGVKIDDDASILYNWLQACAFFIMALLVMRLKLFFTPHACLIVALVTSKKFIGGFLKNTEYYYSFIFILISIMAVQGVQNIRHQRNIIGEFSNPEMEQLLSWIKSSTNQNAVFGGPMPTMANILLSTNRPIVNHPHYENAALRNRTYQIYQIFSRKSAQEVYDVLASMKVEYIIIERQWCFGRSREGCAMTDLWDIEDKKNIGQEPLCQRLLINSFPFHLVFKNSAYTVLKL